MFGLDKVKKESYLIKPIPEAPERVLVQQTWNMQHQVFLLSPVLVAQAKMSTASTKTMMLMMMMMRMNRLMMIALIAGSLLDCADMSQLDLVDLMRHSFFDIR